MTQEEKQLLLVDLCARLPYQPMCEFTDTEDEFCTATAALGYSFYDFIAGKILIKPILRPMSSMTEEEGVELYQKTGFKIDDYILGLSAIDWFNAHHFDYRDIIGRGLVISVTEENNPYKSNILNLI